MSETFHIYIFCSPEAFLVTQASTGCLTGSVKIFVNMEDIFHINQLLSS